ncbi:MAG: SEL1-like repeat protein, partial [Verrucomicrobia bacterium]|nr:SEL1-like repeat protein [Verrucomicrobiota bacterium]
MRLKHCLVCTVLLVCAGVAEAGFFESFVNTLAENKAVEQAPDCKLSADEAYARSIELLSDGRQAEAEDLIKSAVKSHRDDIRILFAKAVLERSRWDKDAANVWFAMARKAQGNEALSRAAWLAGKLDRHEAVEENMAELIRLSDENPDEIYLLWLGAIQCREQSRNKTFKKIGKETSKLGKYRYEKLLEKFRIGPVMVHHTYANILTEAIRDHKKALEHRMLAVSMEAKDWTLQGLGNTLFMMDKYEWANAVWARTVRLCPSDADYWNRWSTTLLFLHRYSEAEEKAQIAVRLCPWDKSYQKDLALIQKCAFENKEASQKFVLCQQAVERGDKLALKDLAQCYFDGAGVKKDFDKAFELFQRAFEQGD